MVQRIPLLIVACVRDGMGWDDPTSTSLSYLQSTERLVHLRAKVVFLVRRADDSLVVCGSGGVDGRKIHLKYHTAVAMQCLR